MLILVIFIVSRILLVECAPKIGHVLFDPLIYEAHEDNTEVVGTTVDDTSNDSDFLVNGPRNIPENSALPEDNVRVLSEANPSTVIKEHKDALLKRALRNSDTVPKYGYEFDESLCKEINKVIMCGYNKNQGDVKSDAAPVVLQNRQGCVIRNDRIECGYVQGGYLQGARLLRSQSLTNLYLNTSDSLNTPEQIEMAVKNPFNSFSVFNTTFGSTFPANSARVSYKEPDVPVSFSQTTSTSTQPADTTSTTVTPNSYSKSTHTIKYAEKSDVDQLLLSQAYTGVLMLLSALSSGKITPWLTSRVGIVTSTRQMPTRTSPAAAEIITEASTASTTEVVTSPILETTTSQSKLPEEALTAEDKDALRTKQAIVEDIEGEPAGSTGGECVSCVWKSLMKTPGLRNLDEITTRQCATRCVEIGDRIVCYPFKFKSTSPITL